MKFTKEEASKELTSKLSTKVENIDLWQRTIRENVETLWSIYGENSDVELSDFVENALPLFETTAGFIRKTNADVAKPLQEKIKQLQEEQAAHKPQESKEPNEALIQRLEALEEENNRQKRELKTREMKTKFAKMLSDKGVANEGFVTAMADKQVFTDDFDFEAASNACLELYNSVRADVAKNVTPQSTKGGVNSYTTDTIKAAAEIAKKQTLN